MIPTTIEAIRWSLALGFVAAIAFWRGGPPERLAISGVLVAHVLTLLARPVTQAMWLGPQWGVIAANAETFLVSIYVLLQSRRWWPIASAGTQGISLMMYAVPLVQPKLLPWAYFASSVAFDYLNLLIIGLGAIIEGPKSKWRQT